MDIRSEPGGSGLGQERVAEIQRARILAAMIEVCAERGASNVTVAHIVGRSGVSRRTFYEIFDDGQACLQAAVEQALASLAVHVLPAYECGGRWRERIEAALVGLLSFLEDEPAMGRLLVVETLGAGPRTLARRNDVLARVILAVEEGGREDKRGKAPPPLSAEGVVGGVISILHARLLDHRRGSLLQLKGPLMSMIVLPYLGQAAAQKELDRPGPLARERLAVPPANPLQDLEMRLTYRTVCVLTSVAARPNASNREIGLASGIQDQGQISKLLTRLAKLGLIEKTSVGQARGAPNAWTLTTKGLEVEQALGQEVGAS